MTDTKEAATFRATLAPYRSLSKRGFLILMTCVGVVSFVAGSVFLYMGAWPIFGFFGLDAVLIYVAFKLNYRDGRAYEIIELTPQLLKLTQVDAKGGAKTRELNPYWVRVLVSEWPDGRTVMRLASHGEEIVFGKCLTDDERREFSAALKDALVVARSARFA